LIQAYCGPNSYNNHYTEKYVWEYEIKGYFWKDALEKWSWFHQNYPNSELWDKNKLKQLNIR
jgi:hypothetical protein